MKTYRVTMTHTVVVSGNDKFSAMTLAQSLKPDEYETVEYSAETLDNDS